MGDVSKNALLPEASDVRPKSGIEVERFGFLKKLNRSFDVAEA